MRDEPGPVYVMSPVDCLMGAVYHIACCLMSAAVFCFLGNFSHIEWPNDREERFFLLI